MLSGCDDPTEYEDYVGEVGDVEIDDEEEFRAWTAYTSEEYPPLECPNRYAIQGLHCTGDYCDNLALYCESTGRATGSSTWVPYFSEEGSGATDEGHCVGLR